MQDLIVDLIGAFVMSVIGYISLKHKKGWIEKLLIKNKIWKPDSKFYFLFLFILVHINNIMLYILTEKIDRNKI